ncbi:hypothetical protein D5R81_00220 [Parashewanella spongiae]|uniref:Uncharacterized protein n=1 Tax=Parashewanella spongiae TaxID=342950 RepID=A0A3A6UC14_9GAMM|nr:hypothetical protein [Parashewanella spongiae]MCL1076609.1 hypothetical protein [Parashewanella spongiae]RJY19564.1 hypothetical protein D5R81_00220 [Parashewanella spongiae]
MSLLKLTFSPDKIGQEVVESFKAYGVEGASRSLCINGVGFDLVQKSSEVDGNRVVRLYFRAEFTKDTCDYQGFPWEKNPLIKYVTKKQLSSALAMPRIAAHIESAARAWNEANFHTAAVGRVLQRSAINSAATPIVSDEDEPFVERTSTDKNEDTVINNGVLMAAEKVSNHQNDSSVVIGVCPISFEKVTFQDAIVLRGDKDVPQLFSKATIERVMKETGRNPLTQKPIEESDVLTLNEYFAFLSRP